MGRFHRRIDAVSKETVRLVRAILFGPTTCPHQENPVKNQSGVMMASRLSAAICGVAFAISFSTIAKATSEADAVRSDVVDSAVAGPAIVGAASTYNPFKPGWREGGPNTASGERYDPSAWTAAIKTGLRNLFGGVKFRERSKFALVEAKGKKVVVKINDVGPLTPGRIIDFNERTMRHFDPSLQQGVIPGVKVTPLSGDDWTPGPVIEVASRPVVEVASASENLALGFAGALPIVR